MPGFSLPACARRPLAVLALASLFAPDAAALLVVNLPWVRPAADARSAQAFMRITSTDGARLVGQEIVLSAEVRRHSALEDEMHPHRH